MGGCSVCSRYSWYSRGARLATQRLGATSRLRIVDAILSGTHERGSSHYELLGAFVEDETLGRIEQKLNAPLSHIRVWRFSFPRKSRQRYTEAS